MKVLDTQKLPDGKIVHLGEVSGDYLLMRKSLQGWMLS